MFLFPLLYALAAGADTLSWKANNGDSYWAVARRLSINYLELARLNGNRPLLSGALIRLPEVSTLEAREGDSWASLAAALRVRETELRAVNPGVGVRVRPGDRLRLPGSARPSVGPVPRFCWPATGALRAGFGPVDNIMQYGITITVSKRPVVAAESGQVSFVGALRGLGKTVFLSHPGGYVSLYAGLDSCSVQPGQRVERSRALGNAGSALYFSIFTEGDPLDPRRLLAGGGAP